MDVSAQITSTFVLKQAMLILGQMGNYSCILINLFNREIISYNVVGINKNTDLVKQAFMTVKENLEEIHQSNYCVL